MASSQEGPQHGFSTKLKDVYHPDQSPRRLGITWQDLDVQGSGADAAVHDNVLSQLNPLNKVKRTAGKDQVQTIVDKSFGNVKPGEMLLVLGRPGAGCTSLLKVLANRRQGYAKVSGDVWYGSMNHEQAKQYKGQIVMNTEEELFYPTLTVKQTIDFAVRLKRAANESRSEADYRQTMSDFLLESMSITHTKDTKVGNEFVRGVSGGERKRVSIIETMATRGSIFCWDNSTRGLDASTALDYARAIRDMTNTLGLASIVTLYQAGNGIYELFDKVLVLDSGKQIYYGPRDQARPFMEDLGFLCPEGANVADFLTGVTVPTERQIRPGFHNRYPRTAEAVRDQYHASKIHTDMMKQVDFPNLQQTQADTDAFQQATKHDKAKSSSPFTVGITAQIRACIVRQYQILWGDKATFIIKQALTIVQALIAGSLFYNAPDTSAGLFVKGGALFFALLYNTLTAMSEVVDSFTGRPVLAKHKAFSLFHPAAFCLAQIIADIPQLFVQITSFSLILYWMVGLGATASQFFIFWVVIFATCMCMTALFRLVGAAFTTFDGASKVSGFIIMAATTYTGYMIPKPDMHPWFVWIYWINPLAYAFEAVMGNEFSRNIIQCVGTNLVPHGDNYTDSAYQSCTGVRGAQTGATVLTGNEYLWSLEYSREHLWRNFGIVWAWWALFVGLTVYCTMGWKSSSERGSTLFIPREKVAKTRRLPMDAESSSSNEKVAQSSPPSSRGAESVVEKNDLIKNTSIFTWKNLTYTVKTPSGDRKLLDNVQGWVKPGTLGALMGSSGAGKTTLLDVLAQRKTEGKIEGSILVDGRPLPVSFQRSAGYCEQLDVHEAYATVREALEFSALLRQSRDTSREEKLKYVDTIIDLLELHDIENSLIGNIGTGFSVEQRKRVTIGVELVAKPSILLFLDEPTSGLDGQSAFNTVRFLRKLADAGQAVLVTIHQPSAQLFAQFDRLLLLARGGQTVYFGDIGENGTTIKEYFGRQGVECPPNTNPAEWMIDVCSGHLSQGRNWAEVWLNSAEYKSTTAELDKIVSETAAAPPGTHDDGFQFAMPMWEQMKIVTQRANISLWRNTEYINNKIMLHISSALFNGFTFWMIGDSVGDLQLKLFTIFNFIFVAPGVINQLQPLFITRRDIFESRESKSRMYSWHSFVTALIVSEIPYLILCAILYYVCWYYTIGFPPTASRAGSIFFVMLFYEFVYTGIGQFVAAYAPNAIFASLVNPILIGTLVSFCGALVPYSQITDFWKYWIYYLNPFTYLMGSMLVFGLWGARVECAEQELAVFDTPGNATCGEYLGEYLNGTMGGLANLVNPGDTRGCQVCQYKSGSEYLNTLNLTEYSNGWRDAGIVALFAFSSYALVFVLMKLRTKQSKKAS